MCFLVFVGCVYPGIAVYWAGAEQWQEAEWDKEDRAHKGLKHNLAPKSLMGDKNLPAYITPHMTSTVANPHVFREARADW